ncbi:hypothetical protein VMCG_10332 [Cytospora schulzeri]|uniref:Uncharacterized protein n=1 Tax=Cytospora schulzeri TaxID=448051 RepID=A0A423VCG6_9PEZI|nr:hypothetical protein VMCG_10332 [Valsa malicola]
MYAFSPIHSYVLGAGSVGLGLHAFFRPRQEQTRFGLPLEPPSSTSSSTFSSTTHPGPAASDTTGAQANKNNNSKNSSSSLTGEDGTASPLIYLKGVREITYGVALIALQYQGNVAGVTTFAGVVALAAVGDGLVVWFQGGGAGEEGRPEGPEGPEESAGSSGSGNDKRKKKAWGHWGAAVGLGSWAAWRAFVAYGEWAAFHALTY